MSRKSEKLAKLIREKTGPEPVRLGLVLGTGLGPLAERIKGSSVPYEALEGFPKPGVSGHTPTLTVGTLEGVRVAALAGRTHYYERGRTDEMRLPLEVLRDLGADTVLITNAAGSLRADLPPGNLMMLEDHINLSGANPLIGEKTDARFVNMTNAYDEDLRRGLSAAARDLNISLRDGIYAWYPGPSFETPAEIRAIRKLGADAVGMSTVPKVILARFLGLRVAAISIITNLAAGMSDSPLSHQQTKEIAPIGAAKLEKVLRNWLRAF